ncbi:alkaline shock response membrane anchor protein AmaP [Streptococcus rifensis]
MSKNKKIVIWIIGLWGMLLLGFNVFAYHEAARHSLISLGLNTNWLTRLVNQMNFRTPPVNPFLGQIIFWSSLILLSLIFIALLIISFYPKSRTRINLKESQGSLDLSKSAIDGLVKSVVSEQSFMRNPSISSKLYKNKIKVDVKGGIIPRVAVAEKARLLEEGITRTLQEFVGVDYPLKCKVIVTDTEEMRLSSSESPRVV